MLIILLEKNRADIPKNTYKKMINRLCQIADIIKFTYYEYEYSFDYEYGAQRLLEIQQNCKHVEVTKKMRGGNRSVSGLEIDENIKSYLYSFNDIFDLMYTREWETPILFYKGSVGIASVERMAWGDIEIFSDDKELIEMFNK